MRGVRGDDRVAAIAFTPVFEVRAHEHQAGELTLRAGSGLERAGVEAGHFDQRLLQPPHQLEGALSTVLFLVGMQVAEPRQHHQALVDPRVVLHGAGTEWIEARVDAEVARRELGEVSEQLGLRELRQARRLGSAELLGHRGTWQVVER